MKKKIFFFVVVLGVMLNFSMPIFSMYDAILTRFENDIKNKLDIKKISYELLEIYDGYINIARKQSKNQSAFENLETNIMLEKIRRSQEEMPEKHKEPEPEIPESLLKTQLELEASLRDIIDVEFLKYFESKLNYIQKTDAKDLVNTFQTIEQYRILANDKEAYPDLYKDIRLKLGVDELEEKLHKVKDYYIIGMKNRQVLANIQREIETYRDFTGNLLAYDDIYDSILKRIIELQREEKKPEKLKKEEWEEGKRDLLQPNGQKVNIQVYSQFAKDGGGGASCGYHSLKNSIFIIRSILGNPKEIQNVMSKDIIGKYIGPKGKWRNIIMEKNYENAKKFADTIKPEQIKWLPAVIKTIQNKEYLEAYNAYARIHRYQPLSLSGEWLKEDDIVLLAKYEQREGLLKDFPGIEYTVIENIPMMQTNERGFSAYGTVAEIAQKLQDNNNYIHGFSLGLMGHYSGGAAHWISLVVNKVNGRVQFIVADSIGANRTNDRIVQIMIQELSKKQ